MEYLIKRGKKAKVAHLWQDGDSVCRMASTGGLNRRYYDVSTATTLPICQVCINNSKRNGKAVEKTEIIISYKPRTSLAGDTYTQRGLILKAIGFESYEVYLESDLWRQIRRRALKEHGKRCCVCESETKVLHHDVYSEACLLGHDLSPLYPICETCHTAIHIDNGRFRSLIETSKFLSSIIGPKPAHTKCLKCKTKTAVRGRDFCGKCEAVEKKILRATGRRKRRKEKKLANSKIVRTKCVQCKVNSAKRGESYCRICIKLNLHAKTTVEVKEVRQDSRPPANLKPIHFNACQGCRKNPAKRGESLCGVCKRMNGFSIESGEVKQQAEPPTIERPKKVPKHGKGKSRQAMNERLREENRLIREENQRIWGRSKKGSDLQFTIPPTAWRRTPL